jgi:hypothetical protein
MYFIKVRIYMGDMKKKELQKSLEEKAYERELRKQEVVKDNENKTIESFVKKTGGKDKSISARVNGATYTNFRKICQARGITPNACINMLITDFVRENKKILVED